MMTFAMAFEEVGDDRCDCFLTNGNTASYFSGHKFYDFRSLSEYANVPGYIDDAYKSSYVEPTSEYFTSEDWTSTWKIQGWNNSNSVENGASPVLMVHSPNNVYIETNRDESPASETFLTLRTARLRDFQSSAQFESLDDGRYQYISSRMLARTAGAPGAITAMFTYRGGDSLTQVQESDLEFRTMDPPRAVQYTNQPAYTKEGARIDRATRNATTPGARGYRDWAVYRMDWTPRGTTWYVDGREAATISFQAPRDPSRLIFNAWSDGSGWTGNMTAGAEAFLHVQWIEIAYNTTAPGEDPGRDGGGGGGGGGSCYNVCGIDETENVGAPVLLQGGASSILGQTRGFGSVASWMPWLAMAVMAYSTGCSFHGL